jgi:hypothetical protein
VKRVGWLGLVLFTIGTILRQSYYWDAIPIWMVDAYEQGARTRGSGAPMNYYHQDWPVPTSVSAQNSIGLSLLVAGLVLVVWALAKVKQ